MKVQEGFHRFMVKIQMEDGCFENRHLKRWVSEDTELRLLHAAIKIEFSRMYTSAIVRVKYMGPVVYEYKYDDWELAI